MSRSAIAGLVAIAGGDEVVVRGNEALENGQAVIVQRREES